MSTQLQPIPLSKAKTAWGLLQDVKRALLAEPKRVNMTCFVSRQLPSANGPACGTVGCFAGWVALLAGRREQSIQNEGPARKILGALNYYTVGPLRDYVFNGGAGDRCRLTFPGTIEHARAVVARINRFMRINARALKARKLALPRRRTA